MKPKALEPLQILQKLKRKYDCPKVSQLKKYLKGANQKEEREAFYGALFAECLNKISTQKYRIIIPEKDDHRDCELLNVTQYEINQGLQKNQRVTDHFLIQNVLITSEAVKSAMNQGVENIYEIFKQHLERTKLSPQSGDYLGCILVFYIGLTLIGKIKLEELRRTIRNVEQNKFKQIWTIVPDRDQYQIGELLNSNNSFLIADFSEE